MPLTRLRRLPVTLAMFAACGCAVAAAAAPPSPRLQLAQPPYAGIRCSQPNSIACDRIGLAVWLIRPARELIATVSGRTIQMRIPTRNRGQHGYYCAHSCYFEGLLQHAGLLRHGPLHVQPDAGEYFWAGRHARPLRVHLLARYSDGSTATTKIRILLRPGWG